MLPRPTFRLRSLAPLMLAATLVPFLAGARADDPPADPPPAGEQADDQEGASATAETPSTDAEPAKQPRVVAPQPVIDAGVVTRGSRVTVDFRLDNQGDADLAIKSVQPACGCTVASFDSRIAAGESGTVRAVVDTGAFAGPIAKSVTVLSNDPVNPRLVLTVKADIRAHVLAQPSYARLIQTRTMPPTTTEFTVASPDRDDFRVLGVDAPHDWVSAEVREATEAERIAEGRGTQWRIAVTIPGDAPVGPLLDVLKVRTNHPGQPELVVPLSGMVRPVLHLTPEKADFGSLVLAGQAREMVLTLINFGTDPVTLGAVTTDVKDATVDVREVEAGKRWRIALQLPATLPKGKLSGDLIIETSSPEQPRLEIPVTGRIG